GQGFARREVTEDLSSRYPAPLRGLLNIGLLHTSADGRPGHESYAPCSVASLQAKGETPRFSPLTTGRNEFTQLRWAKGACGDWCPRGRNVRLRLAANAPGG
ncbi:MAG: hypothetical protein ACKOJF_30250, partial [Planctomycetaceae bacterium]